MRTVAAYALESNDEGTKRFDEVVAAIDHWLREKGWTPEGEQEFANSQGNRTRVARIEIEPPKGRLIRFIVIEALQEAIFSTEISVACDEGQCALFVELRVEGTGARLRPFRFDARRPKFIGRLLHGGLHWELSGTPLTDRAYHFSGANEGKRLADVLWHPERAVPAVAISLVNGEGITPDFVAKLAGDLAGLAIVATLDEDAAWALTRCKGSEWSCFNGALRLYWPFGHGASISRLHPFWLRATMLGEGVKEGVASYRMRSQLRRMIMGVSALSIRESPLARRLTRAAREKRQEDLRRALSTSSGADEYRAIAESYAKENDVLREDAKEMEVRISELEDQVSELQLALRFVPHVEAQILPDVEEEPTTVSQAVELAKTRFYDSLIFADSIDDGIITLNPEAGPPAKVLRYLKTLHELGHARAAGTLGKGVVPWLEEQGVKCSVESESIKNGGGRQWMVNGTKVAFDYHLKPSDGVSPDKCVRIYFDLLESGQVRIGWIGRHPD